MTNVFKNNFDLLFRMASVECPLCRKQYSQLCQHLKVVHRVLNSKERLLLLSLSSGRVDFRIGVCPVPACGKSSTRLDRHLLGHTELRTMDHNNFISGLKRQRVIESLAKLRASNPDVALVSTLDLEDPGEAAPLEEEREEEEEEQQQQHHRGEEVEEEQACDNPRCQAGRRHEQDLVKQVDTLSEALRVLTRRYRLLQRRSRAPGSSQLRRVTSRLLSALRSEGAPTEEQEEEQEQPQDLSLGQPLDQPLGQQPSTSTGQEEEEEHLCPEHVVALSE